MLKKKGHIVWATVSLMFVRRKRIIIWPKREAVSWFSFYHSVLAEIQILPKRQRKKKVNSVVKTWGGQNKLLVQKLRSVFIADSSTYKVSEADPLPGREEPAFLAHKNIPITP